MKHVLLPALLVALCGCATFNRPELESPPYLQVLAQKGVDAGTYTRISKGRVLGYEDIMALVRAGVPGSMIVPYLKATKTPYDFTTRQINSLVNAGADDELVNYLGKAKGIYLEDSGNVPATTGDGSPYSHPYWSDPYFMDPAPFAFDYPGVWYNSDYWRNDNQGRRGGGGGGHGGGGHGGR